MTISTTRQLQDGAPLTDPSTLRAVYVHRDGRCLGMTGVSKHIMDVVPAEFVRDYHPFNDDVDIYVPLSARCNSHQNCRHRRGRRATLRTSS